MPQMNTTPVVKPIDLENKQIIVMRDDLGMDAGKIGAQAAHASLAAVLKGGRVQSATITTRDLFIIPMDDSLQAWLEGRFKKITLRAKSEAELLAVYQKALDAGLRCALIQDAGLTVFDGVPTYTCCAIGPALPEVLKPITGKLQLFKNSKQKEV